MEPAWSEEERRRKKEKIFSALEAKRRSAIIHPQISRVKRLRGIVASVMLLIGMGIGAYYIANTGNSINYLTKTTSNRNRSLITLSDGSTIGLNTRSSIRFPEKFDGESRDVYLEGEAFFDVKKDPDRPFIVHSGNIQTRVLGTSFNVRAFKGEALAVTVKTGKVNVISTTMDESLVLGPGDQAISQASSRLFKRSVDVELYTAWVNRSLEFDLIPFDEVIGRLEKAYNLNIEIENNAANQCLVRGRYKNEQLINVLEGLKLVVNFEYHIKDDNRIIINGIGCVN